jgi:phenylacetate-CoA ligase
MALEFRPIDFAYPAALIKLRSTFEKTQWFTNDQQIHYQEQLLRRIIEHAYSFVPYYRDLFNSAGLKPGDIQRLSDLNHIPILTREILRSQFERLKATNCRAFRPQALCTSGTTGQGVQFLVDKPSNVLEFVYYWRYWNWAGYRLGNLFAEFSSGFFSKNKDRVRSTTHLQRLTGRLLLDSSTMSHATVRDYVKAIVKHRPLFLKGLPSVLYYFSLFLRQQGVTGISFKAVFSTGEILVPRFRKLIEETFGCKVYDSYGHMERTVAISECPSGGLHINPDYGVLELVRHGASPAQTVDTNRGGSSYTARVVGTSLYNLSMPLIRYDVGDTVLVDPEKKCACGRQFPLVSAVGGRLSEVIITPEGNVITAAFLVFEDVPDILAGQIVQESLDELRVRVVPALNFSNASEACLKSRLQTLAGPTMQIRVDRCDSVESLRGESGKVSTVVSKLQEWDRPC